MNITSLVASTPSAWPAPAEKVDSLQNNSFSSRFKNLSYSNCEYFWSYFGKITLLTRNLLNAAARSAYVIANTGKDFPQLLKNITTKMRLFSIVSVSFSIKDVSLTAKKILNSLVLRDPEGVALSTLSFTIIATDVIDSFQTFINTSLTLTFVNPNLIFTSLGLPFGYTMSGLGVISRTIQVAKAANLYRNINNKINAENGLKKEFLLQFLEETLGISEELKSLRSLAPGELSEAQRDKMQRINDKNKADIIRAAPMAAVKEMEKLIEILQETSDTKLSTEQMEQTLKSLQTIQQHIVKKIRVDMLGIVANLFNLTALILFTLGSVTALSFVLKSIAFSIRLGALYHQDQPLNLI